MEKRSNCSVQGQEQERILRVELGVEDEKKERAVEEAKCSSKRPSISSFSMCALSER
jgi:hypothetical protein